MVISLSKIKHKLKKNKKLIMFLAILTLIFLVFFLLFGLVINPVLVNTIELRAKSVATRAMNSAISDVIMNSIVYDDLINIVTDELGNISMIQANSLEINNLSKDLAQTTENKIEEYGKKGISIAVGSFTGIPFLVGLGPSIRLNVSPIGSVYSTFSSEFESAGVNQTIHRIYLNVNASVGVVLPLYTKRFVATQNVLIAESIIVGSVPEVYLYSDSLDTLLNFVPY